MHYILAANYMLLQSSAYNYEKNQMYQYLFYNYQLVYISQCEIMNVNLKFRYFSANCSQLP